jgi:hypothetical protein
MSTEPSPYLRTSLPPNTIVPENDDLFIPYFNRLYEDIAYAVNSKDYNFFPIPITDTAVNIPNLPNFGAFIVCVSGVDSSLPTLTASLCKSDTGVAGAIVPLGFQIGTGLTWAGATLTITSTATNFQVNHSVAGVTGNFNIRIIGTQ